MSDALTVWVVSGNCGDYYCGCGLGHLLGVAFTAEDAERLRVEGVAATHTYRTTDGPQHRSYEDVDVSEVPAGQLLHRAVH